MSTTAYTRAYRARNPEKYAARVAVDTAKRAQRPTKTNLGRYGITLDDYYALLDAQGGVCAICGQRETRLYRGKTPMGLSVDHVDTEEGPVVRGLLCHACNLALGFLRDDPQLAVNAAEYLDKRRG